MSSINYSTLDLIRNLIRPEHLNDPSAVQKDVAKILTVVSDDQLVPDSEQKRIAGVITKEGGINTLDGARPLDGLLERLEIDEKTLRQRLKALGDLLVEATEGRPAELSIPHLEKTKGPWDDQPNRLARSFPGISIDRPKSFHAHIGGIARTREIGREIIKQIDKQIANKQIPADAEVKILEVCSGKGGDAAELVKMIKAAGRNVHITCVEVSAKSCEAAEMHHKKRGVSEHITVQNKSISDIDQEGEFDIVVGFEPDGWVYVGGPNETGGADNLDKSMEAMAKAMKPGGIGFAQLWVSNPSKDADKSLLQDIYESADSINEWLGFRPPNRNGDSIVEAMRPYLNVKTKDVSTMYEDHHRQCVENIDRDRNLTPEKKEGERWWPSKWLALNDRSKANSGPGFGTEFWFKKSKSQ